MKKILPLVKLVFLAFRAVFFFFFFFFAPKTTNVVIGALLPLVL